jgi:hypothetical protein
MNQNQFDLRLRGWEKLKYLDPAKVLPKLRKIQLMVADSNLPARIKNLRTNLLKKHNERRQTALFCYGMGKVLGSTVVFCPVEDSDYDAIARWCKEDTIHYAPLQIKEVVPESLNPSTDLNKEILKLKQKYSCSSDTVFVMHLNRAGRFDLKELDIPRLTVGQLWIFGTTKPTQEAWFLAGDLLNKPKIYLFTYPLE